MPKRKIGIRHPIRVLREEAGYSRAKVSELIGVSERAQVDWEDGKSIPTLEYAVALAKLYKIPIREIIEYFEIDTSDIPDDPPNP